jgi:2-phosphoglycerate kinase
VIWIGGSTCAGKSSVAELIAASRGWDVYRCDVKEHELVADVTDEQAAIRRWLDRSLDDTWVELGVDELVAETVEFFRELVPMLVADVRAQARPLVAEGHQLLPQFLAPVLDGDAAVWLVATLPFRLEKHFQRPHAWTTPRKTRDPERAQQHRLERDACIAQIARDEALACYLPVIDVDGSTTLDEVCRNVEQLLARSS